MFSNYVEESPVNEKTKLGDISLPKDEADKEILCILSIQTIFHLGFFFYFAGLLVWDTLENVILGASILLVPPLLSIIIFGIVKLQNRHTQNYQKGIKILHWYMIIAIVISFILMIFLQMYWITIYGYFWLVLIFILGIAGLVIAGWAWERHKGKESKNHYKWDFAVH